MQKSLILFFITLLPILVLGSTNTGIQKSKKNILTRRHKKSIQKQARMPQTQYPLLRLKMVKDAFNEDDIAIAFNAAGTLAYNNQLDSRYLPGINAPEGLNCLSSDSVQLSVYTVALPKQAPVVIKLDVEAANSGTFTLQRTELDTIPLLYDFWLIDKYQKDSIDLRKTANYFFSVNKSIKETFGNDRFQVIVRQSPALAVKLLSFAAVKSGGKANIAWTTANEGYNSSFTVERSIDGGSSFYPLTTVKADSLGRYSAADGNPVTGTDTYRLKVTDINGTVTYSSTSVLSFQQSSSAVSNLSVYPNPSGNLINLTINQSNVAEQGLSSSPENNTGAHNNLALTAPVNIIYTIKILNVTGAVLKTSSSSSNNWQGSVSSLSPGTYIIRVLNNADNSVIGTSTFVKL